MTDEELIEQVARVIIGPREPVPEGSQYSTETLRVIRWDQAENSLRNDALWAARAILPIIKAERIRGGVMVKEAFRSVFTELLTLYALKVDGMPLEQARIHAETAAALRLRALSVPAIVEAGDGDL